MNNLSQKKLDIVQVRFERVYEWWATAPASEILYGSDRGLSDCGEKKVKKVENEEKEKSTEVRIEAGNMKISVVKFWVDYKLKGIEFLCV